MRKIAAAGRHGQRQCILQRLVPGGRVCQGSWGCGCVCSCGLCIWRHIRVIRFWLRVLRRLVPGDMSGFVGPWLRQAVGARQIRQVRVRNACASLTISAGT